MFQSTLFSLHIYEEAHPGFMAPWSTLEAFRDTQTREHWYQNDAKIELQLQKRILRSKSGSSSLRYFDGASMNSYQLPSSAFETVHYRQEEAPKDCDKTEWLSKAVVIETNNTIRLLIIPLLNVTSGTAYIQENMCCITSMADKKFF